MRFLRDEKGSVLVLTALSITLLLSFLALAIDAGYMYLTQRQLQTLADAAAMAGALEVPSCSGTANCGVITTAATTALTEGGAPAPTLFKQCAAASGTGLLLTINNGPCALSGDPNSGNKNYVEAVVTQNLQTFFAGIVGFHTVTISARAEAGKAAPNSPCLIITGTSGQSTTLNSGARITDAPGYTCGLQVNSSGTPAVMEDGGAVVNLGSYNVVGGVTHNGGSFTPAPTTGAAAVADPFASLTPPAQPANSPTNVGTVNGATTLQPGTYGGLNFNGGGYTVTLAPGLYYFTGGINGGNITINGSGVTIYMANGQLNTNSSLTVNLTAPASALSNCASCAGMLIWQPASNGSQMNLDAGSNSNWGGAVYLPGAQLTLNGDSTTSSIGLIVTQSLMANSAISIGGASSSGGSGNGSTTVSLAE